MMSLRQITFYGIRRRSRGFLRKKQRILIAQSLLNDPKIIILDDPTAGLDPKERIRIRNFISEISLNKIILFATHVVSDIEFIAKEIVILKNGELIVKKPPQDIIEQANDIVWEIKVAPNEILEIGQKYIVSNISSQLKDSVTVKVISDVKPIGENATAVPASIEDVCLYTFRENIEGNMNLLKYEYIKLFLKKSLLVLVAFLLLINCFLYASERFDDQAIIDMEYAAIEARNSGIIQKYQQSEFYNDYAKITNYRSSVVPLLEQYKNIDAYRLFISEMSETANELSSSAVFNQTNTFSSRNIKKKHRWILNIWKISTSSWVKVWALFQYQNLILLI